MDSVPETSGLRFTCVPGCIRCCQQPGWVYLTEDDIARAAAFLTMDRAAFEERYVYRTRHRIRLRKPPGGSCHFLESSGCRIHPAKPLQCSLFPFWPELVEERAVWDRTGDYCPGIGQGPLIQIGTALEMAHQMKQAMPELYDGAEPGPAA